MNIPSILGLPAVPGNKKDLPTSLIQVRDPHPPRLSSDGPITVATVKVRHRRNENYIKARDMLERIKKDGGNPVDLEDDLKSILTHGLVCPCEHLLTGIEAYKERSGLYWLLILHKDEKDGRWHGEWAPCGVQLLWSAYQVLCYDPRIIY